jgi:hypothetical protein
MTIRVDGRAATRRADQEQFSMFSYVSAHWLLRALLLQLLYTIRANGR